MSQKIKKKKNVKIGHPVTVILQIRGRMASEKKPKVTYFMIGIDFRYREKKPGEEIWPNDWLNASSRALWKLNASANDVPPTLDPASIAAENHALLELNREGFRLIGSKLF